MGFCGWVSVFLIVATGGEQEKKREGSGDPFVLIHIGMVTIKISKSVPELTFDRGCGGIKVRLIWVAADRRRVFRGG